MIKSTDISLDRQASSASVISYSIYIYICHLLLDVCIIYFISCDCIVKDVVEWSRALDVRLSEWCCSVTMVWVQIPSREEQKFDSSKI